MSEQFINIRVESLTSEKSEELIRHCLRSKKEIRAINNNDNVILLADGSRKLFKRFEENEEQEYIKEYSKTLIDSDRKLLDKQKEILKNNGKYLNKKRTNQVLSGVITFSNSILEKSEDELLELEKSALKTVKELCKKYNTNLHYLVFHKDEAGHPHFHFSVDNFDNITGLTFNKSKNFGSDLQDIVASHFDQLGFQRGIKKEDNFNRKHLSVEEYKEYKDTLKANKELIEANNELKIANNNLINENNNLLISFMEIISDIEEFATEADKAKKTTKWLELWERYTNSNNTDKRDKLLKKALKIRDKIKPNHI